MRRLLIDIYSLFIFMFCFFIGKPYTLSRLEKTHRKKLSQYTTFLLLTSLLFPLTAQAVNWGKLTVTNSPGGDSNISNYEGNTRVDSDYTADIDDSWTNIQVKASSAMCNDNP
ncbi:MAG: hypothetical protein COA99_14425, partial [Moraxellaceae bacterium]